MLEKSHSQNFITYVLLFYAYPIEKLPQAVGARWLCNCIGKPVFLGFLVGSFLQYFIYVMQATSAMFQEIPESCTGYSPWISSEHQPVVQHCGPSVAGFRTANGPCWPELQLKFDDHGSAAWCSWKLHQRNLQSTTAILGGALFHTFSRLFHGVLDSWSSPTPTASSPVSQLL